MENIEVLKNKLKIYEDILLHYQTVEYRSNAPSSDFDGICDLISEDKRAPFTCYYHIKDNYPEFYKYKPHRPLDNLEYWWKLFSHKPRIRVVTNIIKDLKTQIKEK